MGKVSPTIRGYIWWMYPRGSVHYDTSEVIVKPEGNGFVYRVAASGIQPASDADVRESLLRAIEPVAGEIQIDRYEPVRDSNRNIIAYKVWGHR